MKPNRQTPRSKENSKKTLLLDDIRSIWEVGGEDRVKAGSQVGNILLSLFRV